MAAPAIIYASVADAFNALYPKIDPKLAEAGYVRTRSDYRLKDEPLHPDDIQLCEAWCHASTVFYNGKFVELELLRKKMQDAVDYRHLLPRVDERAFEVPAWSLGESRTIILNSINEEFEVHLKHFLVDDQTTPPKQREAVMAQCPFAVEPERNKAWAQRLLMIAYHVQTAYKTWRESLPDKVDKQTYETAARFASHVEVLTKYALHAGNALELMLAYE